MDNAQIAQRIKLKCKEKNVSVAKMLRCCDLNATTIYEMEKRDKSPRIDTLVKIALYLECSIDYLVGMPASQ